MKDIDKEFLDKKRPKQLYDVHHKDYELIIKHYQKIIDKDKNFSDAYVNLGFIYLDSEDYDKAIKCFQKIVELEPKIRKHIIIWDISMKKWICLILLKNVTKKPWN
jgi:Tetratricopeptide repeat.